MKRIKRSEKYEVIITLSDPDFINPPRESQKNAMINRALKEFTFDLEALHKQCKFFVPGATVNTLEDREQKLLTAAEIMEDWQIPVMERMAATIAKNGGSILEIGFGRGISADMIQKYDIDSHTIIECNDAVVDQFHSWKAKHSGKDIKLVHGLWQNTLGSLGLFDGIFFHTYPLNENEYMRYVNGSITFAEHFFSHAADHLKSGGKFTYFSNEVDSLSREHQRRLLNHFSSFSVSIVPLQLPEDVKDTWWANTIAVISAVL